MNKIFGPVMVLLVAWSCSNEKKSEPTEQKEVVQIDSTLVTDSSWGPITRTTDIDGLQKMYGNGNVKDDRICGPECIDSVNVTIVYPETNKTFVVYWNDSAYHKKIEFIQAGYSDNLPYHTSTGLKLGSTMADLLKINGRKINFSGFGWDYGGYIISYNGGALDNSNVNFRMDLVSGADEGLVGDTEVNTDMPSVKKVLDSIRIWQISLNFNRGN